MVSNLLPSSQPPQFFLPFLNQSKTLLLPSQSFFFWSYEAFHTNFWAYTQKSPPKVLYSLHSSWIELLKENLCQEVSRIDLDHCNYFWCPFVLKSFAFKFCLPFHGVFALHLSAFLGSINSNLSKYSKISKESTQMV